MHRNPSAVILGRRSQRGEVLILSLLVLLVLYLGFLYTMRGVMQEAETTGNFAARQRVMQVADVVVRKLQGLAWTAAQGQAWELSAYTQPWYRNVAAGTASPTDTNPNYWATCLGNADSAAQCGSVDVSIGSTSLPYTALVAAQPTGRSTKYANCPAGTVAHYYDIYMYIQEGTSATVTDVKTSGATVETVMIFCIYDPANTGI